MLVYFQESSHERNEASQILIDYMVETKVVNQ